MDYVLATMLEDSVQNAINENTENTLNPAISPNVLNYISRLKKNKVVDEDQVFTNMLIHLP